MKTQEAVQVAFARQLKKDRDFRHWVLGELHKRQTDDERTDKETRWNNAVGFSKPDAPVLTALAEKLENGEKPTRNEEHQLLWRLPKYWGQFCATTLIAPPSAKCGKAA
jgi:hypothetical protein